MQEGLSQLSNAKYVNLETFRKNGQGVRTPVWFAIKDGKLYVRTTADSGKIKRLRRNPRLRMAACRANGEITGQWVEGIAEIIDETGLNPQVKAVYKRKYGLPIFFFDLLARLSRARRITVAITPDPGGESSKN